MMKKNLLFLVVILLGISSASYAATITWTGLGPDDHWDTPGNWDVGVPTASDNVVIDIAATITASTSPYVAVATKLTVSAAVTLDVDLTVITTGHAILISSGGTLNFGATGTARAFSISTASNRHAVHVNGGDAEIAQNSTLTVVTAGRGMRVESGSTMTINGDYTVTDYAINGIQVRSGGTVENNKTITINAPSGTSSQGIVVVGTFNNNAAGDITITGSGTDGILVNGGAFDNIEGGDITITGALLGDEFRLSNAGTVNNSGTMTLTAEDGAVLNEAPLVVEGGTFTNNSTGVVNTSTFDSAPQAIYVTDGTILNSGTLNLPSGNTNRRFHMQGTTGTITNNACGIINMGGRFRMEGGGGTFTNNGLLKTTYSSNAVVNELSGTATNNGLVVSGGTSGWGGTDNGLTLASGATDFAIDAVNSCGATDIGIDVAHDWYSDAAMTTLVGANDAAGMLTINDNSFTTSGPHTLYSCYGSEVTMTISNLDGTCLPVELMSFEGIRKDDKVALTWVTASEENNYGFEVERAYKNGAELEWEMIDFVAGNGTTFNVQTYSYDDVQASQGTNYYRLKQLDFDGKFEYSDVISVDFEQGSNVPKMKISPNPVRSQLMLADGIGQVTIFNVLGQPVKDIQVTDAFHSISLEDLPNGQYVIRVQKENGAIAVQQFSKID